MNELELLAAVSRLYGADKNYVIAGGGNTSYKNNHKIWVKASGTSLATMQPDDLAILDREKLNVISEKKYSEETNLREEQVKQDLAEATITKEKRPSVETSIHNVINYPFIVHLHPTLVNGLMCANDVEKKLHELFGKNAFLIPYTDPGYVLFKKIEEEIEEYRKQFNTHPQVIWLQNHGIFVGAATTEEIKNIYADTLEKIKRNIHSDIETPIVKTRFVFETGGSGNIINVLTEKSGGFVKITDSGLIQNIFYMEDGLKNVSKPFIPDQIVYCKSNYIFIDEEDENKLIEGLVTAYDSFLAKNAYAPKVIVIKGIGLVALGSSENDCAIITDVFEDAIKIAAISKSFGGPHPMTDEQIHFIENWEVENYRRKVATGQG